MRVPKWISYGIVRIAASKQTQVDTIGVALNAGIP